MLAPNCPLTVQVRATANLVHMQDHMSQEEQWLWVPVGDELVVQNSAQVDAVFIPSPPSHPSPPLHSLPPLPSHSCFSFSFPNSSVGLSGNRAVF